MKNCLHCKKEYTDRTPKKLEVRKYCSHTCSNLAQRGKKIGKPFRLNTYTFNIILDRLEALAYGMEL